MPQVSYLKAPDYQDAHAGYSNPLDEQHFLVDTINHLQRSSAWRDTAVIILYDDSDGWYDHQFGPLLRQSQTSLDDVTAVGQCGPNSHKVPNGQQARCGLGMRQPLLVVSPFSKSNFVDSTLTTPASVVQLIEDNFLKSQRIGSGSVDATPGTLGNMFDFHGGSNAHPLFLDPGTGEPSSGSGGDQDN
jgi:phospholipase C